MNIQKIKTGFLAFFSDPKKVYWFGFVIALVATTLEVMRGRAENYQVFSQSTFDFWNGVNPYSPDFVERLGRYFLYTPVFSVLFTPIAYLPGWLGPFVWNMMNYSLLFLSVMTLPSKIAVPKVKMFLYLLLLLEQSIFPFQYNIVVCYIFLFAFSLMEKDKPFWAVLLIMISATTKIYGAVELAMLFCYKNTLRNFTYAILIGLVLLTLPVIKTGIDGLLPYYGLWADNLHEHNMDQSFVSLIHHPLIRWWMLPHAMLVQIVTIAMLAVGFFCKWRCWKDFRFRASALGVIMAWTILFSDASEVHTYIIAFAGYLLWFYTQQRQTRFDNIMYWVILVLFGVMPIDALCPPAIHRFEHNVLWLDVICFTIVWCRMLYTTMCMKPTEGHDQLKQRMQ